MDAPALTGSTMADGGKLLTAIYYLLVEWVVFFLIAIYGQVNPRIQHRLMTVGDSNGIWSQ